MISLAIMTQTPDGATDVVETRRDRGRLPLLIEIDTVLHRLLILAVMTTGAALHAEDWLRFRGPNGSGIAAGSVIERPSFEDNLIWKTALPAGHSSPVIAGARIYLTAVEDEKLFTLALDRSTGRILWRRQAPRPRVSQLQENNNAASPTPASDGENVYVFFGDFGLLSYGADGNERWRIPLGPFRTIRGMAASPIVVDGKVLLVCDADGGDSFLIAADAETGRQLWRADRSEFRRAFSTPAVHRPIDGPAELIVPGAFTLTSYSIESGEELWRAGGLCWQPKAVPLIAGGRVYLNCQGAGTDPNAGRYPGYAQALEAFDANGDGLLSLEEFYSDKASRFPDLDLSQDGLMDEEEWNYFRERMATRPGFFAVRLGGRGDISRTHREWVLDRPMGNVPSPLLYDGVIYSVRNAGILASIDAETGEILKRARLPEAVGAYFASPVAAEGKLFFVDAEGTLTVVRAAADWAVLHSLKLGEGSHATPAIADGRLYVRTFGSLYCFGS